MLTLKPNTTYDLSKRVMFNWEQPHYDYQKNDEIIVEFDCNEFSDKHWKIIHSLSAMLKDSGEIGKMNYDIFSLTINSLNSYEKDLVKNENSEFTN